MYICIEVSREGGDIWKILGILLDGSTLEVVKLMVSDGVGFYFVG